MFIAAIIGATIVILTVFYAVILFIACIIDQHKWEHDYDDDSDDENSNGTALIDIDSQRLRIAMIRKDTAQPRKG